MTKRVLIADDEPLVRQSICTCLSDRGYETAVAAAGIEALSSARETSIDAVLLDVSLDGPNALEVIAALAEEHPNLPIIAVLAPGRLDEAVAAMRAGAWDIVVKPFADLDAVTAVLERVLERASLLAERDDCRHELTRLRETLEAQVLQQTEDLRNQNRRLMVMNRVTHAVSHAFELDTMLDRALDAVLSAVEAEAGLVQLVNPSTECLYVAAAQGFGQDAVPFGRPLPAGAGLAGQVVQDGHVKMGRLTSPQACIPGMDLSAFASYALVPLHASDNAVYWVHERSRQVIVGLVGVFSARKDAFQPDELELLTTVGNQLGVAVTRAQYAADLRRANLQLETANQELKRLDALREQFIQNVAHELRTPLALVRGYVELLADGGLTPDSWRTAVDVARKRVLELVELVEAITTLQDLDTSPLSIKPVSLPELVMTACQMTHQRATSSGIRFRYGNLEAVKSFPGDFSRLALALHQVLDNACKFSDAGTLVTVSTALSADDRYVTISVADQGIGIPEEERARIFDRFYQIDGTATRRYGGTGLGLALARETVEAHRGWIRVESAVGVGSTFTLGLPRVATFEPDGRPRE